MVPERGNGGTGRRKAPPRDDEVERDVRQAIYRFQGSAYANLRSAVANVTIFCGVVATFMISDGAAKGPLLIPTALFVPAGLVGAGYYLARTRPGLGLQLLLIASAFVIIAVAGVIAVQVTS